MCKILLSVNEIQSVSLLRTKHAWNFQNSEQQTLMESCLSIIIIIIIIIIIQL